MATAQLGSVLRHIRRLAAMPERPGAADAELLRRYALKRDQAAFAELVHRHGRLVWSVCRHVLGHDQDAEDAFQATFLALAVKGSRRHGVRVVAGWLHGAAFRSAMQIKRQAARRRSHEQRAITMAQRHAHNESSWREVQAVLDEELSRLAEKYQAPFVLCCLEGKSKAEAAQALGWKEGTVSGRLAEARKQLQRRLARRGVTLSAVLGGIALSGPEASAAVPGAVTQATLGAVKLVGGGQAALEAAVPAKVAAVVRNLTQTMFVAKCKIATALAALVVSAATGAGLLSRTTSAEAPASAPPAAQAKPEKAAPARTDRSGDPLPQDAIARLGTARFRHSDQVYAIAFSRDGQTLASAGLNGTVCLWDVGTGKKTREFTAHQGFATCVSFAADGKRLLTAGWDDKKEYKTAIRLWDLASAKQVRQFQGDGHFWSGSVALAPDGQTVAVSGGWNVVYLWDVATGKKSELHCEGVQDYTCTVAFSRDSKVLASGGGKMIRIWNVAGAKQQHEIGSQGQVHFLAFSPNQRTLAAVCGSDIRLFEANTAKELRQFKGHTALAFAPNGRTLLAAGEPGQLVLWDVENGKEIRTFAAGFQGRAWSVAFSPDGQAVACGTDSTTIHLWETATGKELHPRAGHRGLIKLAGFAKDGKTVISSDWGGAVRCWETATGKELPQPSEKCEMPQVISADGRFLVSGWETLHLWNLATGKEVRQFQGSQRGTTAAVFSPDGRLLITGGRDRLIRICEVATGKEIRSFSSNHMNQVGCLAVSPDGQTLASGGFDFLRNPGAKEMTNCASIRLWNVATGKELAWLQGAQLSPGDLGGVGTLAFSPDGKTIAAANAISHPDVPPDVTIRLWDAATGRERQRLQGTTRWVSRLAFSPDGKELASSGGDGIVRLWELATGKERHRFEGHGCWISSVAFSSDGTKLVSAGGATAMVWAVGASPELPPSGISPQQLNALWNDLASDDARQAYRATATLQAAPRQAIELFQAHLQPAQAGDAQRLAQLIAELDDKQFAVREKASEELARMADAAAPALRKALASSPSAEVRRRAEALLEKLEDRTPSGEQLRALRAVEVLDHIGTPAALQLLGKLAKGLPQARLTREANAALERLARRRTD